MPDGDPKAGWRAQALVQRAQAEGKEFEQYAQELLDCPDLDAACAARCPQLRELLLRGQNLFLLLQAVLEAPVASQHRAMHLTQALSTSLGREAIAAAQPVLVAKALLRVLLRAPPLPGLQCDVLLALLGEVVRSAGGDCAVVPRATEEVGLWIRHLQDGNLTEALLRLVTESPECFWAWMRDCQLLKGLVHAGGTEGGSSEGALRVLLHCLEWAGQAFEENEELQQLLALLQHARVTSLLPPPDAPGPLPALRFQVLQSALRLLQSAALQQSAHELIVHLAGYVPVLAAHLESGCSTSQLVALGMLLPMVQLRCPALDSPVASAGIPRLIVLQVALKKPNACLLRNSAAGVLKALLSRVDEGALQLQDSLAGSPSVFELLACGPSVHHAFGKAVGSSLEECAQRSVALLESLEGEPAWWRYRAQVLQPAWDAEQEADLRAQAAARQFREEAGKLGKHSPSESFFFSGFD